MKGIEGRIQSYLGIELSPYCKARQRTGADVPSVSCDQLKQTSHYLLASACSLAFSPSATSTFTSTLSEEQRRRMCWTLFDALCVKGWSGRQQVGVSGLLLALFGEERWWGDFVTDALVRLFATDNASPFPQERLACSHRRFRRDSSFVLPRFFFFFHVTGFSHCSPSWASTS